MTLWLQWCSKGQRINAIRNYWQMPLGKSQQRPLRVLRAKSYFLYQTKTLLKIILVPFVLVENEHMATYKTWVACWELSSSDLPSQSWCDRNTPSSSGYDTCRAGFRLGCEAREDSSHFWCVHSWCTATSSSHKAYYDMEDPPRLASWERKYMTLDYMTLHDMLVSPRNWFFLSYCSIWSNC